MDIVSIRALKESDALTSYKWRNDPEVWKYTGTRPNSIITEDIELSWIRKVLRDETSKRFAILYNDNYVGNVQLTDINSIDAEFHIFIGEKENWGKGISNEATKQILFYAKEELKLLRVYLKVNKNNLGAVKSYERNGFYLVRKELDTFFMEKEL